jgi:uncharacterized protein YecE (DUF72 family)
MTKRSGPPRPSAIEGGGSGVASKARLAAYSSSGLEEGLGGGFGEEDGFEGRLGMKTMRMLTGTSGYSYKEWLGHFYPPKTPASAMLRYYAERLPTVEINNTFYKMPDETLLQRWSQEVPESFAFTLKAPRRLTHIKRLKGVEADVAEFLRRAGTLGDKLGMLLFQLPPNLRKDLPRLRDFLAPLPSSPRVAVEFRHDSWHDEEVYEALRDSGAAFCIVETDEQASPIVTTADVTYMRLRRTRYDDRDLAAWAERLAAQPLAAAYVYFKHEGEGLAARFALRLGELWRTSDAPGTSRS